MFVHNAEEAAAAEEAGIDMICTSHDAPQYGVFNSFEELKRIREAAPTCFMQSGGAVRVASEYEAMKLSHKYLDIGADVVSIGEMMMALKAGVNPKKIVFSGVGKTTDEINYAIDKKILLINAESKSEVKEIIGVGV